MKILLDNFPPFNENNINLISVNTTNLVNNLLNKENNFRRVIYFYILKLVRLRVNNFEKFKEINFENLGLNKIYSQFKIEEKQTSSLSHKFTDLNNVKKFETFEEDSFEFDQNQDEKIKDILQLRELLRLKQSLST